MANKKAVKGAQPEQPSRKHFSESSPNPHGESKILHMPISTDHRKATGGKNVPQVPNMLGGRLNPSVVHEFKSRDLNDESRELAGKRTRAPRRVKIVDGFGKKKDA